MSIITDIRNLVDAFRPVAVQDAGQTHVQKSPEKAIVEKQKFETFNDLLKWKNALDMANSVGIYNREILHEVYRQVWRDSHVQSQWNTRKMKVKHRQFALRDNTTDEESQLTDYLQTDWFLRFIDEAMDSLMWGFSLIQFGRWSDGKFQSFRMGDEIRDSVYSIDRDYVKPELGIVANGTNDINGINFYNPKYWVLFIGKSHDLGLLEKISELQLIKRNATLNWSEWAEIFGMDMRYAKTDAQDQQRRDLLTQLKNMGANGIGVFSPDDTIEFKGTSRSDAFKVYNELIRYVDEQISKVIFGQDVISNNTGQVVGKTGENVAKLYGNADAVFIQNIVNDMLLPFLSKTTGISFDNVYFQWDNTEELTMAERADIDVKISQMGFKHSDEYINETYLVDVESKDESMMEELNEQENLLNRIRSMYVRNK